MPACLAPHGGPAGAAAAGVLLPALLAVALLAAGCATAPEQPAWPAGIPPRAHFEARYATDPQNQQVQTEAEYLQWVRRFFTGWAGIRGWHSVRDDLLAETEPARREAVRARLDALGRRIAGEWAKASPQRAVRTRTIQVWGNAALEAVERGEQMTLVEAIAADVDALLAGELAPAEIRLQRYYPEVTAFECC